METADDTMDNVIGKYFKKYVKDELFNRNYIGPDHEYYSGGRCHSRVLGILVQSIQSMGYITDIQRTIRFSKPYRPPGKERKQNGFKPDITVVDNHNNIVGIIEYETIDAAEEHLYQKIEYFENVIPANPTLQFIIFFPTLTTLQRRPSTWIELDRQKYMKPLADKLQELSKIYPNIDISYLILDENGFSSKIIKHGDIKNEDTKNIWEDGS